MQTRVKLSPLAEVKLPEDILASFATLFLRLCLAVFLIPVLLNIYRSLIVDPSPNWIPLVLIYLLSLLFALRPDLLTPRQKIVFIATCLSVAALSSTVRNQSIQSASAMVFLIAIAVMAVIGLRRTLILSTFFLLLLSGLSVYLEHSDPLYGSTYIALALGSQTALLIAINAIWNTMLESRYKLEQNLHLIEVASAQSRIGLFRHEQDKDTWSVNGIYRQLYGINNNDPIIGREHILKATHPDDRPKVVEQIKRGAQSGEHISLDHRLIGDKGLRWVRVNISVNEEQGTLVAYGSVVDIHDYKMRQDELDRVHRENEELLEHLKLATFEADIRIVEENLTQKTAHFISRGATNRPQPLTWSERRSLALDEYKETIDRCYESVGSTAEYAILDKHYLTSVSWFKQTLVNKFERDGDQIAIIMVSNITKDKRAQLKLERSLKQVEAALTRQSEIAIAGQIGLFDWSVDSDILRPNAIFRQQTGLSEERYPILSTRDFFQLFDKSDGVACINQIRDAKPDSGAMEFQLKMQTEFGKPRWVRLVASVHQAYGEGAKVSGSLIDLTEHLELEQQLREANAALQRQSRTDALTQVSNRRGLDEYLETQLKMRQREPDSYFSLLMLDIDYFKDFNDIYGHPEGDTALKCVADILAQVTQRPSDLAARFGGEEFMVVLPSTDNAGALQIATRVQQLLKSKAIVHEGSPNHFLTVSIGTTTLAPMESLAAPELVGVVDLALYAAKENGRNRIEERLPEVPNTSG